MPAIRRNAEKLPPREKLKFARRIEEEKRRLLDEEIQQKREELEQLEEETKRELDEAREVTDETLDEITRESAEDELEARVKQFRESKEFVSESDERVATGGFGQVTAYTSEALERVQENLDYLLNATPASQERRQEVERDLYSNLRRAAEHFDPGESYAFNKVHEQMYELKQRDGAASSSYIGRSNTLINLFTDAVDYKAIDEAKRRG